MDWKIILVILQGFVIIINAIIFAVVKFNDLKHLTDTVNSIKKDCESLIKRYYKLDKAIIKREAICNERHGMVRKGKK
jgi:hypothetical protein